MNRAAAAAGSLLFLLVAPGTAVVLLPWLISRWRLQPALLAFSGFRIVGLVLIAAGAAVLLDSFVRFALQGLGTPAPIAPPKHLVVSGLYRYVRNPMYVGVVSAILGQGLLLGNRRLLGYGTLFWLLTHLFVILYEEPKLRRTFGSEYRTFCASVPRWIPRLTPWRGTSG